MFSIRDFRCPKPLWCWALVAMVAVVILTGLAIVLFGGHADAARGAASLAGSWQVLSLSIRPADGQRLEFPDPNVGPQDRRPDSVAITENKFTLRMGDEILEDWSYSSDLTDDPWTIDLKSTDGAMLGICMGRDDILQVNLNDQSKGRPRDFQKEKCGMVLVLRRYRTKNLWIMNVDGSDQHQLVSMPGFDTSAAASWSPDSTKIAFHAIHGARGETWQQSHIFVVKASGGTPSDLGPGALPSWSPDGKRMAYSDHNANCTWVMNADGSGKQMMGHDILGASWSPTRDEMAFPVRRPEGANLCVRDLKTNTDRALLQKKYLKIQGGFAWSPDGSQICFLGYTPSETPGSPPCGELGLVHAEGAAKGFKVLLTETDSGSALLSGLSWSKVDQRILTTLKRGSSPWQLYFIDPEGRMPPQSVPGQDPQADYGPPALSPDEKRIVFVR